MVSESLGQRQVGLIEVANVNGFPPAMRIVDLDSSDATLAQGFDPARIELTRHQCFGSHCGASSPGTLLLDFKDDKARISKWCDSTAIHMRDPAPESSQEVKLLGEESGESRGTSKRDKTVYHFWMSSCIGEPHRQYHQGPSLTVGT